MADFVSPIIGNSINGGDGGIPYLPYVQSHWKLDETTGNALNALDSTYDFTETGTVPAAAGKLDGCRGVFSTSNYFALNNAKYDTQKFLVEGWFNTSAASDKVIMAKGIFATGGWQIYLLSANNALRFNAHGGWQFDSSTTGLNDGGWHHFACARIATSGADGARIYIDGANDADVNVTGNYTTDPGQNATIAVQRNVTSPFVGLLDDITYWDTVPATWGEIDTLVTQRWNGGNGRRWSVDP